MNTSFIDSLPESCITIDTFLRDNGYECEEDETTDPLRWRYYYQDIKKNSSNVLIRVILRFELCIHDDPFASYDDNHSLSFNDVYLEVYDRQMEEEGWYYGERRYDEETESTCKIDSFPINPKSFEDISILVALLTK